MHEDNESRKPFIEGLVVREFSPLASNWRSDEQAEHFLAAHNIPVAGDIDTRALVRHLRSRGVMRGVLSGPAAIPKELVEKARGIPSMAGLDLATRVSTTRSLQVDSRRRRLLAIRASSPAGASPLPRGRLRLRHQAQHPPPPGPHRLQASPSSPPLTSPKMCSP